MSYGQTNMSRSTVLLPAYHFCGVDSPLLLELLEDFPLGVVAHDSDIDKPAEVETLGPELRHDGAMRWSKEMI